MQQSWTGERKMASKEEGGAGAMDPTVTPTELSGASVSGHETVKDKGRFTLYKTEFAGRGGQNCIVYRRFVLDSCSLPFSFPFSPFPAPFLHHAHLPFSTQPHQLNPFPAFPPASRSRFHFHCQKSVLDFLCTCLSTIIFLPFPTSDTKLAPLDHLRCRSPPCQQRTSSVCARARVLI